MRRSTALGLVWNGAFFAYNVYYMLHYAQADNIIASLAHALFALLMLFFVFFWLNEAVKEQQR